MSDEEDHDDGFKIKSPQSWRSPHLNVFIKELDRRLIEAANKNGKKTLKKKRVISESPMKRVPKKKSKWIKDPIEITLEEEVMEEEEINTFPDVPHSDSELDA